MKYFEETIDEHFNETIDETFSQVEGISDHALDSAGATTYLTNNHSNVFNLNGIGQKTTEYSLPV
jgi:hypothetical protein